MDDVKDMDIRKHVTPYSYTREFEMRGQDFVDCVSARWLAACNNVHPEVADSSFS